ncbi:ABC transporter permease [Glycomyces harbinensis]|uniref:Peptide/nickel transport system permease protein n=1 Tax=Glycomyces harbinensis TaxID=58114 RepID=A0A1G6V898_9ACTN|nr:ABC transporter permease [Glycomyces harbinensis]SDD49899.1 peptide/nickel transport system permease protein [Glycomyces harbinensis]
MTIAKIEKLDRLVEATATARDAQSGSLVRQSLRRLRRSPMAVTGAVIVGLFVIVAVLGPLLAPYDPTAQTWGREVFLNRAIFPGPRAENWFGLDHLGRDMFSRMIIGARQTLLVGVVATLIGLLAGAVIGGVAAAAGTFGGRWGERVEAVIMRTVDVALAIPMLLLALSVAALLGPSLSTVMIAVGVAQIPIFARLLRGSMLAQAHSDYVLSAIALGVPKGRIVVSHILPNSLGPVIVQATLVLATAIIEAAALSYLGLGNPDPGSAEWGTMLADAQRFLSGAPQLAIYPAVAIIVTALGFTLLGEAMRESLDPRLRRQE